MVKKTKNPVAKLMLFVVILTFVLGSVVGSNGGPIIENALFSIISANPDSEITIIAVLDTNNEGMLDQIKEATKAIDEQIDDISEDFKENYRAMNKELGYYENEKEVLESFKDGDSTLIDQINALQEKYGLDADSRDKISFTIDKLNSEKIKIITEILNEKYAPLQSSFIRELNKISSAQVVYQNLLTNSVTIKLKAVDVGEVAKIPGVNEIIYGEWPDTQELQNSVPTTGATTWHSFGFTGSGSYPLFINSDGINIAHIDIDHINFISGCFYAGCNPINTTSGHDTAVVGVIGSSNIPNKGVSSTFSKMDNAQTNNFGSAQLAINWSIVNVNPQYRSEHITMSKNWGDGNPTPSYCGDMVQEEYVDEIIDLFDVNWVKSAGNNGMSPTYKGVTLPAGAYNIIAVGASDDKNTVSRTDDIIWSGSSLGPVGVCSSAETRIKPDITAPGVGIQSPTGSSGMGIWTGTSFSSPHVTGAIVLIDQLTGESFSTEEITALLLNTAEDRLQSTGASGNDGPDNTWGYGYMDMNKAYFEVADVDKGNLVGQGNNVFYKVESVAQDDKATMTWNRHIVSNNGVTNNLDLFLYDEATGSLIDSSEYIGRNIEQVQSTGAYNSAVLKVNLKTLNTGSGEEFGIAVNGALTNANLPTLSVAMNISKGSCGFPKNLTVNVKNNGLISAHNVNVDVNLPSSITLVSGSNPQNLGTINAGQTKVASWMIKQSNSIVVSVSADVESNSYGQQIFTGGSANSSCYGLENPGSITNFSRAKVCKIGSTNSTC